MGRSGDATAPSTALARDILILVTDIIAALDNNLYGGYAIMCKFTVI